MHKVYIAVCSCRDWKTRFGASLCGLIDCCHRNGKIDPFLNILQGASVLPRARQLAIQEAAKGDYSHILMLDDDMLFPRDLLEGLLERNLPIVGINYARKNPGAATPMACDLEGKVLSSKGKAGVEEVGWLGFGAILINLDAIKTIEKPWFEMRWMEQTQDFMGEDYYFCMKARNHGVKLYIDHDASARCAHIGDYPFQEI